MTIDIKATAAKAHNSATMYFAYLVAADVALVQSWPDIEQYVPQNWRHGVLAIAAVVTAANKIYNSIQKVDVGTPQETK